MKPENDQNSKTDVKPYYFSLGKLESQIEFFKDCIADGGGTYFFENVIHNLNLLRFYQHKYGKVNRREFAKFMKEAK